MLIPVHLHPGQPAAPHDVWTAWNLDPLTVTGLIVAGWLYRQGGRRTATSRMVWFWAALVFVAVAIVSPLDAVSGSLASAHMVQHLLLIMVAAPLFAMSSPGETMLTALPLTWRKRMGRLRRHLGLTPGRLRGPGALLTAWLAHAGTLWVWHASVPYEAALASEPVHLFEHLAFLLTAMLFWGMVLPTGPRPRVSPGLGVLAVFAMALQGVLLSALMTFASHPWYPGYADTTAVWGVSHLTDQQLAGVIMWVPAGLVYTGLAMVLLHRWVLSGEGARPGRPASRSVR